MRAALCAVMSVALVGCAPGPPPPGAWVVEAAPVSTRDPVAPTPTPAPADDPAEQRARTRAPTRDEDAAMRRFAELSGVRVCEQGAVVVDGVRVEATSLTAQKRLERTILEHRGDGVFLFPDGLTEVVVRRRGAATVRWSPGGCGNGLRLTDEPGLTVLELELQPEVQLTGRLVDTHGIPLFSATVSIGGARVLTDSQGRFAIGGLTDDVHVLIVDTPDPLLVPRTRFQVRAPGDVELVVDRAGELLVHVDLPRRGESRSVVCSLREDMPHAPVVQVYARAGEPSRLSGLRPGRYVLAMEGPGFVPQRTQPFEVVAGGLPQVRFLAASRLLRARPVRPDGARVATVVRYTTAQGIDVTKTFGALVILPVPRDAVRVRVTAQGLEALVDLAAGKADVDLGELRLAPAS